MIRRATPFDIQSLYNMWIKFLPVMKLDMDRIDRERLFINLLIRIKSANDVILVAEENDIVGFMSASLQQHQFYKERMAICDGLYIEENSRAIGLPMMFQDMMHNILIKSGVVELICHSSVDEACHLSKLWAHFGFTQQRIEYSKRLEVL